MLVIRPRLYLRGSPLSLYTAIKHVHTRFAFYFSLMVLFIIGSSPVMALEISGAYVRGLPPVQKNTAAFFTLHNPTNQSVTVTAGTSGAASRLEMHRHVHRQGMMAMELQPAVVIGPNERFVFAPGGHHLMLINLRRPLRDGDSVSFSLSLSTGEQLEVTAPVVSVLRENSVNQHEHGSHK